MNSAIICTIGCFGYIGYFCPKRLAVDAIVDTTSVRWEPKLAYKSWNFVLPKPK